MTGYGMCVSGLASGREHEMRTIDTCQCVVYSMGVVRSHCVVRTRVGVGLADERAHKSTMAFHDGRYSLTPADEA